MEHGESNGGTRAVLREGTAAACGTVGAGGVAVLACESRDDRRGRSGATAGARNSYQAPAPRRRSRAGAIRNRLPGRGRTMNKPIAPVAAMSIAAMLLV